jgi:hypothetical protein
MNPIFLLSDDHAFAGGQKAGAYLDSIGQTDLAKLNVEQYKRFCAILVGAAWSSALDAYITTCDSQPPF